MPLHMIFRAGSLIANMVMGIVMLGKRYTTTKYISVLMITAGIITCTIMSAKAPKTSADDEGDLAWLCVGIFLLTFALLLSARMGIYQEVCSSKLKIKFDNIFSRLSMDSMENIPKKLCSTLTPCLCQASCSWSLISLTTSVS